MASAGCQQAKKKVQVQRRIRRRGGEETDIPRTVSGGGGAVTRGGPMTFFAHARRAFVSVRTPVFVFMTFVAASGSPVITQSSELGVERSRGLAEILAGPLPGTIARGDEDAARAIEQALLGFDGVDAARVIITSDPTRSPDARRAAVQMALGGDPPSPAWIENIAEFIVQAVPGLASNELTMVDTSGRVHYVAGASVRPPAVTVELPPADLPRVERTAWLVVSVIAGAGLVTAFVLGWRRDSGQMEAPSETSIPLAFIQKLGDDDLCRMLAGERPAVVAAVIKLAPPDEEDRLRRCCKVQELPVLERSPTPELIAALEKALRARLEGS